MRCFKTGWLILNHQTPAVLICSDLIVISWKLIGFNFLTFKLIVMYAVERVWLFYWEYLALQVLLNPCSIVYMHSWGPFSVNNDRIELYWSSEGSGVKLYKHETDSRFHTPKRCLAWQQKSLSSGLVISLPNSDYARYNQSTMPTCQNTEEWEFMIKCSLKSLLHFGLWIHLASQIINNGIIKAEMICFQFWEEK